MSRRTERSGHAPDRGEHRALHGLTRSLIYNMVEGVTNGYEKRLEIQGVGYRAQLQGRKLVLALGYSHPVELDAPEGIDFEVPMPTRIVVRGISKQAVGEVAANIRKRRPPEPYKGKGIRYEGEYVARKVGKRHETQTNPRPCCARRRLVRAKVRGSADRSACRCPPTGASRAATRREGPHRGSRQLDRWRPQGAGRMDPGQRAGECRRSAIRLVWNFLVDAAATASTARSMRCRRAREGGSSSDVPGCHHTVRAKPAPRAHRAWLSHGSRYRTDTEIALRPAWRSSRSTRVPRS